MSSKAAITMMGLALGTLAAPELVRAEPLGTAVEQIDEAPPRLSAGAFLGGNVLSDEVELGNAVPSDQVPGSGFLLGGRAGYLLFPALAPSSSLDPRLGVELEAKFLFSSTEGDASSMRPSAFSPVVGWRAHAILEALPEAKLSPFLLAGFGGETVFSDSPFMESPDTDAAVHFGAGGLYQLAERYGLRADLRLGVTAGRFQTAATTFEVHLGAYYRFRTSDDEPKIGKKVIAQVKEETPEPPPAPTDSDGDGIPDAEDRCPDQAETLNQIEDDDGCPEVDSDNDGLLGDQDQCPGAAEDMDGFEDSDGCPDRDNDGDGRPDVVDGCPEEPETMNGFEDDDGCPDDVPKEVQRFTGTIRGIKFRSGSDRILRRSERILDDAVAILKKHRSVRVEIAGHTDSRGGRELNLNLSRKRADAVKWYLVDQGIDEKRLVTVGHGPDKPIAENETRQGRAQNRRIEFRLLHGPETIPDPRASEEEEGEGGEGEEGEEGEGEGEGEGEEEGED